MYSKPFPQSIAEKIIGKPCVSDTVGESDSTVLIFEDAVLKIEPTNCNANHEYAALRWLQNRLPVPEILDFAQADGQNFLLMSKLRGAMASDRIAESIEETVKALADGLQQLWRVDISDCPLDSTLGERLQQAKYNIENGLVDTDDFEPETLGENGFADVHALYDYLERARPSADLVFTHGDFCLPNIFTENGKAIGFLDLGKAGIADRWQDIALCVRSLEHNICTFCALPKTEFLRAKALLYSALGISEDKEKLRYYILLDELF